MRIQRFQVQYVYGWGIAVEKYDEHLRNSEYLSTIKTRMRNQKFLMIQVKIELVNYDLYIIYTAAYTVLTLKELEWAISNSYSLDSTTLVPIDLPHRRST